MNGLRGWVVSAVLISAALTAGVAGADPVAPNLVGMDINFSYGSVAYTAATGALSGSGTAAAMTFEPALGGSTYPVFNLSDFVGADLALAALFDHAGTGFDVDGFFATAGTAGPDLTLTGKIPALGIAPGGTYSGTLLEADVMTLEMYGGAGAGAFAFNGYFRVTGGDLVLAGYLAPDDVVGMRSWLSGVSPALSAGFDFASDFSSSAHVGEFGSVPEPATLGLIALGVVALARRRRR